MKLTFKSSAFGPGLNTTHKYAKTVGTLAAAAETALHEQIHSNLRVSRVRLYAKADYVPSVIAHYVMIGEWILVDGEVTFVNSTNVEHAIAILQRRADEYAEAIDALNETKTLA